MPLEDKHIQYYKSVVKITTQKYLLRNYSISWKTNKRRIHALFITVLLFQHCYYQTRATLNLWAVLTGKMLFLESVSPVEDDAHLSWMSMKCGTKKRKSQKREADVFLMTLLLASLFRRLLNCLYNLIMQLSSFILICMYLFEFIQPHYEPRGQRGKNSWGSSYHLRSIWTKLHKSELQGWPEDPCSAFADQYQKGIFFHHEQGV